MLPEPRRSVRVAASRAAMPEARPFFQRGVGVTASNAPSRQLRAKSGLSRFERRMPESNPPFRRLGPDLPTVPVVLSVPHAGRGYSDALLTAARLSRPTLEALADWLVKRLVWRA